MRSTLRGVWALVKMTVQREILELSDRIGHVQEDPDTVFVFSIEKYPEVTDTITRLEESGCEVEFCNLPHKIFGNSKCTHDIAVFFCKRFPVAPLIEIYKEVEGAPPVVVLVEHQTQIRKMWKSGADLVLPVH